MYSMSTGIKKISSKGLGLSLNVHESFSFLHFSIDPNNGKLLWPMGFFKFLRIPLGFWMHIKVIYTKYSKHCPYAVAHTIDCVCRKC